MAADITSTANERIKWLVRLQTRRHRDDEGVFVVEGRRLYQRALGAGLEPVVTFVGEGEVVDAAGEVVTVGAEALDRASYREHSEGLIAVFPQRATALESVEVGESPLVLVAENVEKPGNLGAMLRTVGAAGADALITVGNVVDVHNPNAIRASTGAVFSVPLGQTDWVDLKGWLSQRGIRLVAATPDAARPHWDEDLGGAIALVVGAEDEGLGEIPLDLADAVVSIPQAEGSVDSLNVSVAAGVLLFEAVRQRRAR